MVATAEVEALLYKVNQRIKPSVLEGLSEKLLDQHWKLYEGYVTHANLLSDTLLEASKSGTEIHKPHLAELQRRFGFEYNGMVLHEYYFAGMRRGIKEPPMSSPFSSSAASSHGSFENWKKQFMEIGKMRGVGWTIAYFDPLVQRLVNVWVSDHEAGHIAGFIPVIVMDCWEHAYILDYGAGGRAEYVKTYFRNLNWEVVEERFEAAAQGQTIPRIC
jgi:Fe-Mn family superoxide dismutase